MGRYVFPKDKDEPLKISAVEAMMAKCRKPRDRFMIAFLYLTGARPVEFCLLQRKNFDFPPDEDYFKIQIYTAKRQEAKGIQASHRQIEVFYADPFAQYIADYAQGVENPEHLFWPLSIRRLQQIVDKVSDGRAFPYNFRHTRIIKLLRETRATVDEVASFKGGSLQSLNAYRSYKPVRLKLT